MYRAEMPLKKIDHIGIFQKNIKLWDPCFAMHKESTIDDGHRGSLR